MSRLSIAHPDERDTLPNPKRMKLDSPADRPETAATGALQLLVVDAVALAALSSLSTRRATISLNNLLIRQLSILLAHALAHDQTRQIAIVVALPCIACPQDANDKYASFLKYYIELEIYSDSESEELSDNDGSFLVYTSSFLKDFFSCDSLKPYINSEQVSNHVIYHNKMEPITFARLQSSFANLTKPDQVRVLQSEIIDVEDNLRHYCINLSEDAEIDGFHLSVVNQTLDNFNGDVVVITDIDGTLLQREATILTRVTHLNDELIAVLGQIKEKMQEAKLYLMTSRPKPMTKTNYSGILSATTVVDVARREYKIDFEKSYPNDTVIFMETNKTGRYKADGVNDLIRARKNAGGSSQNLLIIAFDDSQQELNHYNALNSPGVTVLTVRMYPLAVLVEADYRAVAGFLSPRSLPQTASAPQRLMPAQANFSSSTSDVTTLAAYNQPKTGDAKCQVVSASC